ncbi:MAG: carbamoyl-phosphate synthase large subunit, partial [Candidatus Azotimanducaceae bacterium]
RYLDQAVEVDVDAVCDGKEVVIGAVMQHIEQAGVHSGDSACSLPPYSLDAETIDEIRVQVKAMALELNVIGLMNVQLAIQQGKIYVLEVNPRASRTVPFVSKCIGVSLAKIAARCMAGTSLEEQGFTKEIVPKYFSVKEAVFPFGKFPNVDPILGPEMKSTGEVMGVADTFAEAYRKSQVGAGDLLPEKGTAILSVRDVDKQACIQVAEGLIGLGFSLAATRGTAMFLKDAGIEVRVVNKVLEGHPHIVDMLKNKEVNLIVNTTEGRIAIKDSAMIRKTALRNKVYNATTMAGAQACIEAIGHGDNYSVHRLQDLHKTVLFDS